MGIKRNLEAAGIGDNQLKITEDEAALYDRQIRLWGMDCQRRLREAKILMIGMNGVGAEITKNLALSGVKSITLMDDKEISTEDTTAQFFISTSSEGQRAQESVIALKELNPNVEVNVLTGDVLAQTEDFFKDFHAVVATNCPADTLIKLDEICRKQSVQFYCADTWGFYGYCFLDLQNHKCKSTITITKYQKEETKTTLELKRNYCSLGPTLFAKVGEGLRKRVNKVFILFQVVNHFQERFGRNPSPESHEEDVKKLIEERKIVCEKLGYDESKITDEMLNSVFGELSPICSVIGGVLANEIIKGISGNGIPVFNYFLFDGHESVGVNEMILVEKHYDTKCKLELMIRGHPEYENRAYDFRELEEM